jgi:NAD dependent epimerase/dehydratase family enzyme
VVSVIKNLLHENPSCGPINLVSPNPISSKTFASQLGSALRRPSFLPLPAFAVKILLGEMGEALLLSNSNVVSSKLGTITSPLSHQNIDHALDALLVN